MLEKEIETLKERMTNIQTAWQATKVDLEKKEQVFTSNEAHVKQLEYDALYSKNCHSALKEQVATLLSDGFVKVEANEDQIKEKIKLLMTSSKDRGLVIYCFFFLKFLDFISKQFGKFFNQDDCIYGGQNTAACQSAERANHVVQRA